MNKPFIRIIGIFIVTYTLSFYPLGSQDDQANGLERLNFTGTITLQDGQVFKVHNITFNRLIKKIIVYIKPNSFKVIDAHETKLLTDPTQTDAEIRLDVPYKIEVPNPKMRWIYTLEPKIKDEDICKKTDKLLKKFEYIEIIVTNEKEKTSHYLVSPKQDIIARPVDDNNTQLHIGLPSLKTLEIKEVFESNYNATPRKKTVTSLTANSRGVRKKIKTANKTDNIEPMKIIRL